jgi:hypothetical protein
MLFVLLVACQESQVSKDGVEHTLSSIRVEPGLSWFDLHYREYAPNDSMCNIIKDVYDPSVYSVVMFTSYLCNCEDNSTYLPHLAKILTYCDIPDSNMRFFLMTSVDNETPFKGTVAINEFPEAYLFKNGEPVASLIAIRDTLEYSQRTFEKAILTAISE